MASSTWAFLVKWAVLPPLMMGCSGLSRSTDPPADPLFVLRKPEETPARASEPTLVAWTEPTAPTLPEGLRENRPSLAERKSPTRSVPGTLTNHGKKAP